MSITVNSVETTGQTLVDCEFCGPLGVYPSSDAPGLIYNHLRDDHGCNMDHIDIRNHEENP